MPRYFSSSAMSGYSGHQLSSSPASQSPTHRNIQVQRLRELWAARMDDSQHSSAEMEASSHTQGGGRRRYRGPVQTDNPFRQGTTSRSRQYRRLRSHYESREFDEAEARMAQEDDELDALLEDPLPYVDAVASDHPRDRIRYKRRKLDHIPKLPGFQGFDYGHEGQVVSGKLKMEIASCDGGNYVENGGNPNDYWCNNVLKDDQTVYCTKSNRCNMILRHQGETTFCLTSITIKAPKDEFSAPLQEGMVFISMTSDDLLARTARYEIHYDTCRRSAKGSYSPYSSLRPRLRALPDNLHPADSTDEEPETEPEPDTDDQEEEIFNLTTLGDHSTNTFSDSDLQAVNDFTSSTDTYESDKEDSTEDEALVGPPRVTVTASIDGEDGESLYRRRRHYHISRRSTPSRIELSAPPADSRENRGNDEEVMTPSARFFIAKDKSMINIKFDPPLSARFILLKMWSPSRNTNIDIQSIVVHGFAGPRFFPTASFR